MTTLNELREEMIRCRTLGHAWDSYQPLRKAPKFGDLMAFRCVRCETCRHDIVSWVDGTLVARSYIYPDEYHLSEKYAMTDYRLALLSILKPAVKRRRA